jgi:hypothetical protein
MDREHELRVPSYQIEIYTDLYESFRAYHFKADVGIYLLLQWSWVPIQSFVSKLLDNIIQLVLLFVVLYILKLNLVLHFYIILEGWCLVLVLILIFTTLNLEIEARMGQRLLQEQVLALMIFIVLFYHTWLFLNLSLMVIRIYIPLGDQNLRDINLWFRVYLFGPLVEFKILVKA